MSKSSSERRRHKRHKIACPVVISGPEGSTWAGLRTVDLSDGGLVSLAGPAIPAPDQAVRVRLSVPRTTPNTYMLEDFACQARVVRQQTLKDSNSQAVALQFDSAQTLALEV